MTFSSCLINSNCQLVIDTSVVINVLATGHAPLIFQSLEIPVMVTEDVLRELNRGYDAGHRQGQQLQALIDDQVVGVDDLTESELEVFFELVSGSNGQTLGDGEASTLALTHSRGLWAGVDEKRATQVAFSRFAGLPLATTVDILAHPSVQSILGRDRLSEATWLALTKARMQVREHQFEWIAELIGPTNVLACKSLSRHVRRREKTMLA